MIDPNEVEQVLRDCLYRDEEMEGLPHDEPPPGSVTAQGILSRFAFHPERLESHREQVREWLMELPVQFRQSEGGGWSFLNACLTRDGEQWTGLHQRMDQLFVLGMALGLVKYVIEDREVWKVAFPGGMPYMVVLDQEGATA